MMVVEMFVQGAPTSTYRTANKGSLTATSQTSN